VKLLFIAADGQTQKQLEAEPGERLLEVAQAGNIPLEGTCEGAMACSTCHVIIEPSWFDKLPPASEEEEDMLDFALGVSATSRLACQIRLTKALDGLVVRLPIGSRNMSSRS
jgi:ferredoxin-2, mitochondrial